jgi:endonuclease/exonuclease/phosphatase family metal-dependent hydrolase
MENHRTVRLMTYNVHSCVGVDRRLSHGRIVEVIAAFAPDIVALQELDVGKIRSGRIDQAQVIAEMLKMKFHYHPAIEVAEEKYGDAVFSRFPLRLIKAGALPTVRGAGRVLPRRGALWVAVDVDGLEVNVINTHMGVNSRERGAQSRALLGEEWASHPECRSPVIVCGDFNAVPASPAYRRMRRRFRDVQRCLKFRHRHRTYPARYPLIRIDHVFISTGIEVLSLEVPSTPLTRIVSDHLPLIADLRLS